MSMEKYKKSRNYFIVFSVNVSSIVGHVSSPTDVVERGRLTECVKTKRTQGNKQHAQKSSTCTRVLQQRERESHSDRQQLFVRAVTVIPSRCCTEGRWETRHQPRMIGQDAGHQMSNCDYKERGGESRIKNSYK